MSRRRIVSTVTISVFAAVLLSLTGCGGSSSSGNTEAYKPVQTYGDDVWTYGCADGYVSVDIAIGDMVQRDGSSYSLKETKDDQDQQTSVTLTIKLAGNQQIPVIIVDNAYHAENPAGGQALYKPQLQGASTLSVMLPREGFGGSTHAAITKVTACTKYSAAPKS